MADEGRVNHDEEYGTGKGVAERVKSVNQDEHPVGDRDMDEFPHGLSPQVH